MSDFILVRCIEADASVMQYSFLICVGSCMDVIWEGKNRPQFQLWYRCVLGKYRCLDIQLCVVLGGALSLFSMDLCAHSAPASQQLLGENWIQPNECRWHIVKNPSVVVLHIGSSPSSYLSNSIDKLVLRLLFSLCPILGKFSSSFVCLLC